jgi:hypothetical protein
MARQDDAGLVGEAPPEPGLSAWPRLTMSPNGVGQPIDQIREGFTPQGRMTLEAPVRAEPHPTTALPRP